MEYVDLRLSGVTSVCGVKRSAATLRQLLMHRSHHAMLAGAVVMTFQGSGWESRVGRTSLTDLRSHRQVGVLAPTAAHLQHRTSRGAEGCRAKELRLSRLEVTVWRSFRAAGSRARHRQTQGPGPWRSAGNTDLLFFFKAGTLKQPRAVANDTDQ